MTPSEKEALAEAAMLAWLIEDEERRKREALPRLEVWPCPPESE